MDTPATVLDAVHLLEGLGYTDDLRLDASCVRCNACGNVHEPEMLVVTHTFRYEGESNPDDEAIVLGVQCPACGVHATIVSAYGPEADPELFEALARLSR